MKIAAALALLLAVLAAVLPVTRADEAADVAATTLTKVGDPLPEFIAFALDGSAWSSAQLRGKVAVISLFATWCPPCNAELPHVEKELWQTLRNRGLVVVAIAREEGADKLKPFAAKLGLTFPLLSDPDRKAFSKFATNYIPRLYVVGADGRIKFQTVGFEETDFPAVVAAVNHELPSHP
jgi:peroxiredoxin